MSAKRCGLASLLLNIKGPTPRFTKLVGFAVNGELYFTSQLLGFPHRLVVARKPIFRLIVRNELSDVQAQVRYRSFKAHIKELRLVYATMSGGKQSHNLINSLPTNDAF